MRKLRWPLLIAILGIIAVVALLLTQSSDPAILAPQPVEGGAYSEALIGELQRLNPLLDYFNQPDQDIGRLIFSGLVRFDSRGNPHKELAESWSISADASLYTIVLREGAVWHDGTPVTSDDVVYTFSKFQDEDYPGPADLHEFWTEINIIRLDDRRVQFQLPEPFAPFLDYLTTGLLPDHLLRGVSASALIDHPYNLRPIGTGPYQFDTFIIEEDDIVGVSLVAFEDYYLSRPFLDRIEFRLVPDSAAAYEAFLNEQVTGISKVDTETLAEVLDNPQLNIHTARLPHLGILFLNLENPVKDFLADKQIRRALMLAVNRDWIIQSALDGQAVLPVGPIMPGTWAFADGLQPHPFDPIEAARILDDEEWELTAGAAPGTEEYVRSKEDQLLALELVHSDDEQSTHIAELVERYWEDVGIQVTRIPVPAEDLLTDYLEPREFEVALTEINYGPYPDPDPYPFWHDSQKETGQNYAGFDDRNSSIWLEQARTTPDPSRRADLYASFQYRFQDQLPSLPLYYPVYNFAIDAQIQGVTVGPLFSSSDRFSTILDWHLMARRNVQPTEAND
ncbi:MAG: peptide ABC transporter substrate-binding protein [Anaerolineales bacterium]|jgi:peptide/nickel transport system substrate-binding protein